AVAVVDNLAAILPHDDGILDAHTEFARQVDPRLIAEDHADAQRQIVALNEIRFFVAIKTEPVSESVDEVLAVARVGDDLARNPVDILTGVAEPICANRLAVRLQ